MIQAGTMSMLRMAHGAATATATAAAAAATAHPALP